MSTLNRIKTRDLIDESEISFPLGGSREYIIQSGKLYTDISMLKKQKPNN